MSGCSSTTIEGYVRIAYEKVFYFISDQDFTPELFDIYEMFQDELLNSGRRFFISEIYGIPLGLGEISMELVQDSLIKMEMEFITMEGEHLGDCQNILIEGWGDEE